MKKYKISYHRSKISREEAEQLADFDQLLTVANAKPKGGPTAWYYGKGILLLIVLGTLFYYLMHKDADEFQNPLPGVDEQISETQGSAEEVLIEEEPIAKEKPEIPDATSQTQKTSPPKAAKPKEAAVSAELKETEKTSLGFIEAAPVAGFDSLYQYFDDNLKYPEEILDLGIEGNVIVRFVIDKNGLPGEITIEKSLHRSLDSTALALIKKMPLWKPAMLNGKPLSSSHRIPLFFQIDQAQ